MTKKDVISNFGQLFILAFDGTKLSEELVEFFKTFRIGGLIFFSDNFQSVEQFTALTKEIQARCAVGGIPLLMTTDHEGGRRQEFKPGFTPIPPMSIFGKKHPDDTQKIHQLIAKELKRVGINLNFAPVADLCGANMEGSIGNRSFGPDPKIISNHVVAAIRGLQDEGILACVKHFPGHGATHQNSHTESPSVNLDFDALEQRDMVPFRAAIKAGVPCVMTAHILYPNAGDSSWPASLSDFWVTEILRNKLNYEGVIISDALEMKALTNKWSPLECGIRALEAGSDMLLYYREKNQFQTFYELRLALERGSIDFNKIVKNMIRIRELKNKIKVL